jgi:hypothetical protein
LGYLRRCLSVRNWRLASRPVLQETMISLSGVMPRLTRRARISSRDFSLWAFFLASSALFASVNVC